MDNAAFGAMITAVPAALAGIAAIITAISNRRRNIDQIKKDVSSIKNDLKDCRCDIAVTKEASFYALQAHVENGSNGDIKKAHTRLKNNVFGGDFVK
jgi:hypothetical protein